MKFNMSGISSALGILSKFIDIGKKIAKLPAFVLPQYQSAATDLYQICQKLLKANGVFARLIQADAEMVAFVFDEVIGRLDSFVNTVENEVDTDNLDRAEELRLEFKSETKEMVRQLEKFSGELSDLTISFAKIARVPLMLGGLI